MESNIFIEDEVNEETIQLEVKRHNEVFGFGKALLYPKPLGRARCSKGDAGRFGNVLVNHIYNK